MFGLPRPCEQHSTHTRRVYTHHNKTFLQHLPRLSIQLFFFLSFSFLSYRYIIGISSSKNNNQTQRECCRERVEITLGYALRRCADHIGRMYQKEGASIYSRVYDAARSNSSKRLFLNAPVKSSRLTLASPRNCLGKEEKEDKRKEKRERRGEKIQYDDDLCCCALELAGSSCRVLCVYMCV